RHPEVCRPAEGPAQADCRKTSLGVKRSRRTAWPGRLAWWGCCPAPAEYGRIAACQQAREVATQTVWPVFARETRGLRTFARGAGLVGSTVSPVQKPVRPRKCHVHRSVYHLSRRNG